MSESLKDLERRLRSVLKTKSIGPILVAREVVKLEGSWKANYEKEAGETLDHWIFAAFAKPMFWFRCLTDAEATLGKEWSNVLDYEALRWVAGKIPVDHREEFLAECANRFRTRNRRNHITIHQVKRAWAKRTKKLRTRVAVECLDCARRQRIIDDLQARLAAFEEEAVEEARSSKEQK